MIKKIKMNKKTLNKLKKLKEEQKQKKELNNKKLKELLIIIPYFMIPKKTIKINNKKIVNVKKDNISIKNQKKVKVEDKELKEIKKTKDNKKIEPVDIITPIVVLSKTKSTKKDQDNVEKYISSKIVTEYTNRLKDIRYEIRKIDYKYKVIEDSYDNTYKEKEITNLIDNLNILIKKIDELKKKLEIPNKYDDKYILSLIGEYINEFNNQKVVKEVKSSSLYIEISNTIKELNKRKNALKKDLNERKNEIKKSNDKLKSAKSKYDKLKKDSNNIDKFEKDAYLELKNLNKLVNNAVSIKEKVEVKVKKSHNLSLLILGVIASDLAINTTNNAKSTAIKVAVGLFLIKHIMNDRYRIREDIKYEITNYTSNIEKEINSISKINESLDKSSKEIKSIIKELNSNYSDYINNNSEFRDLIINLETIDSNLEEKKYMINSIKSKEESLLREHSHKVKEINNKM